MNRIFKKPMVYFPSLLVLIYVLVCIYFFVIQEQGMFPGREIESERELGFTIKHEEVFLETPDGARLNAVLFEADNPRAVVLHFHGNGENILDMEYAAEPFIKRNYNFLAMDYRTYGKSTGELSEENLFSDASLVMQFLESRGWKQSDIILYGRSIGTGIATQLASETKPRGLILYSPYYSMHALVSDLYPFLPVKLLLKYPLNSAEYLQSVACPVLILHGEVDPVIPVNHAKKLSKIKGKLVTIKAGDHNNLTTFSVFWKALDEFMGVGLN
jgi:fermentation-respiration switch protein FrsA (DUF1100 family)